MKTNQFKYSCSKAFSQIRSSSAVVMEIRWFPEAPTPATEWTSTIVSKVNNEPLA